MKQYKLADFTKGWFIGSFQPAIFHTNAFEIAIKHHQAGENYPAHKQRIATEYNVMIEGKMRIGQEILVKGDIFVIAPEEVVKPKFTTDCVVVCIKIPSMPTDKVEV